MSSSRRHRTHVAASGLCVADGNRPKPDHRRHSTNGSPFGIAPHNHGKNNATIERVGQFEFGDGGKTRDVRMTNESKSSRSFSSVPKFKLTEDLNRIIDIIR